MKVEKLENTIQDFAWGSESYLPELLGYANPENKAQAELWMGVHPRGESRVGTVPLSKYFVDEEGKLEANIGMATATKYQGLPFLFKVLAAKQPLSIQAHPNKEQAEEGFARENQLGIPLDAPKRNYKDPHHKPEITLALTPFWALCGFRPLEEIRCLFRAFGAFMGSSSVAPNFYDFSSHEEFFTNLIHLPEKQKDALLQSILENCSAQKINLPAGQELAGEAPDLETITQWILRLARAYPCDLGALAPLYLNLICLNPAQAIYLPAGVLHSYLEGSAMELMANSDNVLRGGLTPKHQDVAELQRILIFEEFPVNIIEARKMDLHRSYYPSTATEFRLECWTLYPEDSALYFPQKHPVMIAFVYEGSVEINGVRLNRGESCIIPVSSGEISVKALSEKRAVAYIAAAKEI